MNQTKNVILIDDDIELTDLLKAYLEKQGYAVTAFNDPALGIQGLQKGDFDLLLLDVMMPVLDGFEVLKKVRTFSTIPIIMLTAKGDDFDRIFGLELGADDYLPKPFNQRELVARMKALLRRLDTQSRSNHPKTFSFHNIVLKESDQSVQVNNQPIELTSTEFELLCELMRNIGQLNTKEHLSQHVLGRKLSQYDRSLDMHISNIRRKLSANDVTEVIKTRRGSGYIMLAPENADYSD